MSHYSIRGVIAVGGMGIVYDAVQHFPNGTHQPRALKCLLPQLCSDNAMIARFGREADAHLLLGSHPNIVQLYNLGRDDHGRHYLSLERLVGAPLDAIVESGPNLKQNAIRRIVHDVVEALAHIHAHDLIHRDLTPRNILWEPFAMHC